MACAALCSALRSVGTQTQTRDDGDTTHASRSCDDVNVFVLDSVMRCIYTVRSTYLFTIAVSRPRLAQTSEGLCALGVGRRGSQHVCLDEIAREARCRMCDAGCGRVQGYGRARARPCTTPRPDRAPRTDDGGRCAPPPVPARRQGMHHLEDSRWYLYVIVELQQARHTIKQTGSDPDGLIEPRIAMAVIEGKWSVRAATHKWLAWRRWV